MQWCQRKAIFQDAKYNQYNPQSFSFPLPLYLHIPYHTMPYHTIIPYLWYATHWAYVRVRLKWMTYVCDIAPLYPTDHNFRALKSGDPHSEEQTLCPSPDFETSKLRNVWSRKFRAQNTFREKLLWKKRSRSGEDQSMHINISSRLSLFSKNFTLYGNWQCAKNMYHWNCNGCSTKTFAKPSKPKYIPVFHRLFYEC